MTGNGKKTLSSRIGTAIMVRRRAKNLTQVELAERLGIEQHSLSRMEHGNIAPKFSRLQQIADELDCSVADLFRDVDASAQDRASAIADTIRELPSPMQEVVVELVENTVASLKKMTR